MAAPIGPPPAFQSSTVTHPVDRTALHQLEGRVGSENALASCRLGNTAFAVISDPTEEDTERAVVVLQSDGDDWIGVGRFPIWPLAYRALGRLLGDASEQIPVDTIDRPSPTLLIPRDVGMEMMYRTAEGIRVAHEYGDGSDSWFEVESVLWDDFTVATDESAIVDEATGDGYLG